MNLNESQERLLDYVATIALDRRMLAAIARGSLDGVTAAIWARLKSDVPAVGEHLLRRGGKLLVRKAAPVVGGMLETLFKRIESAIEGAKR